MLGSSAESLFGTAISPVVYLSKKPDKIDYSLLWDVSADSPSGLGEYLSFVKNDPRTKKLHILDRKDKSALILLRFKGASSTYDSVLSSGVTYASGIFAKSGYEVHNVISDDPKRLGNLLGELSAIGDVKVLRVGDFRPASAAPKMTKKQEGALEAALIHDYYSWPKGTTLERLAQSSNISRRSMQERLRRAEAKLVPFAIRELLKKRL